MSKCEIMEYIVFMMYIRIMYVKLKWILILRYMQFWSFQCMNEINERERERERERENTRISVIFNMLSDSVPETHGLTFWAKREDTKSLKIIRTSTFP